MMLDTGQGCILGATVEVVRGPGLGRSVTQRAPCGPWDDAGGFVLADLAPGVELTLRASAPGYVAQDQAVVPTVGVPIPVVFTLSRSQPAPPPTNVSSASAMVWGFVVDASGVCVEGAAVQVVRGQRVGETVAQRTPCTAWDYDNGFEFRPLTPGVSMTLRASAPGYVAREVTIVPQTGWQSTISINLSRQ